MYRFFYQSKERDIKHRSIYTDNFITTDQIHKTIINSILTED